jgi:lipopolysaccharide/colanic/teichoic acid biosynthesis glycosyltransferase
MSPSQRTLKRILDIVVAVTALAGGWPFLAALAILIRIDSPGPVFFRQERAGRGMRPFTVYKFRTMRPETPPYGLSPRSPRDPRLTRVGRFLRETGLDELPQLWNVLKGEMSLVGPRPLYMRQARVFTPRQRRRLEVRPGLTGLAQVQGRGEVPQEEKLEIDVHYVEQMSLALDLSILCQTVLKGFGRQKGYETW